MNRKEEIIYAALGLASEYGLRAVTLSQIADRVGIKKPSLYNHFGSKEEIVEAMYIMLRERARTHNAPPPVDMIMSLEQILLSGMEGYLGFITDSNMLTFFKVLYSERSTSPAAAQIMLEETDRMISTVRELFYALVVHGKMKNNDVDTAALSYAMTVHSLVDRQMDRMTAQGSDAPAEQGVLQELRDYIKWFAGIMTTTEADKNEQ